MGSQPAAESPWLSWKKFGSPPPPQRVEKKKIKSLSLPYHTLLPAKLKDNQTPMLAPSRNTTEQRYQTNPLGLESNPGSPFSLWKQPLTRQQESKSSLWTDNKRLPADEESWGGQLLCSPVTLTAREARTTRFLSGFYGPRLWSNRSQG